ncbi:MAG: hypothetical protein CSA50_05945 [Gammaproteobacteria bacterium]|nr:MAG: hypothetical protein CSA50_05945 [Gammaproteobacteria bacterium]
MKSFYNKFNVLNTALLSKRRRVGISQSRPAVSSLSQDKILILQGPVGPFFRNLQRCFELTGFITKRVIFHSADALFSKHSNTVRFSGSLSEWESWLSTELTTNRPKAIVLFGSNRPAHRIAHNLAEKFGVPVVALEEGYLRSGYISCELGGNNQRSPLNDWKQDRNNQSACKPLPVHFSFVMMCIWGATYYLVRDFTKKTSETVLYHRQTRGILKEAVAWISHMTRRLFFKVKEKSTIDKLTNHSRKHYVLIPLQAPDDAQIHFNSRGWDNRKLVLGCLNALHIVKTEDILVFKTHPLDENSHILIAQLWKEAQSLGLTERVIVLQSGKLSILAKHSSGMIVINSTSGFSALHHQIPLLVLGSAVFRKPSIVTVGDEQASIVKFLEERSLKCQQTISAFINSVKSEALLPGDFYALTTQRITANHVVRYVQSVIEEKANLHEATEQ